MIKKNTYIQEITIFHIELFIDIINAYGFKQFISKRFLVIFVSAFKHTLLTKSSSDRSWVIAFSLDATSSSRY